MLNDTQINGITTEHLSKVLDKLSELESIIREMMLINESNATVKPNLTDLENKVYNIILNFKSDEDGKILVRNTEVAEILSMYNITKIKPDDVSEAINSIVQKGLLDMTAHLVCEMYDLFGLKQLFR